MNPVRLLVVEDDPDSAEAMSDLLRMEGFDVVLASTAEEALVLFESQADQIDVILLDLMLPDMNGSTLISRLETLGPLPPVVIHSAVPAQAIRQAAARIGAVAVLRKPADWRSIRETLEQAIGTAMAKGA